MIRDRLYQTPSCAANSPRARMPSLRYALERCASTVFSVTNSACAISRFVGPAAGHPRDALLGRGQRGGAAAGRAARAGACGDQRGAGLVGDRGRRAALGEIERLGNMLASAERKQRAGELEASLRSRAARRPRAPAARRRRRRQRLRAQRLDHAATGRPSARTPRPLAAASAAASSSSPSATSASTAECLPRRHRRVAEPALEHALDVAQLLERLARAPLGQVQPPAGGEQQRVMDLQAADRHLRERLARRGQLAAQQPRLDPVHDREARRQAARPDLGARAPRRPARR